MFSQKNKSKEEMAIKFLAEAYKKLDAVEWDYARADTGVGRFLLDKCITDTQQLKMVAIIIGKELLAKNDDAKTASLIFDKLYKDGFKDALYRDDIRERFKEILPQESVEQLNAGKKMADCMQALFIYEETCTIMSSLKK